MNKNLYTAEIHRMNYRQIILWQSKEDDEVLGKCCTHGPDDTLGGQY
jgi:hypothetical protein